MYIYYYFRITTFTYTYIYIYIFHQNHFLLSSLFCMHYLSLLYIHFTFKSIFSTDIKIIDEKRAVLNY